MADGRMLRRAIATSRKMAELKTDAARLLYTWLIPFLDIDGKYYGDPAVIKGHIVPRLKDFTIVKIEDCLKDMQKEKLILWYIVDGDKYLQFTVFKKHQNLYESKEAKSVIPNYQDSTADTENRTQNTDTERSQLFSNSSPTVCQPLVNDNNNKDLQEKGKKETKKLYQEFVYLADEEYQKLIDRFGIEGIKHEITNLNDYIGSTGKKYKSHYYTILKWNNKNQKDVGRPIEQPDQKSVVEQEIDDNIPYKEILFDLNDRLGTDYMPTPRVKALIKARWDEGHPYEHFEMVHRKRIEELIGTENTKYLQPAFLYNEKFDEYRNMPWRKNTPTMYRNAVESLRKGDGRWVVKPPEPTGLLSKEDVAELRGMMTNAEQNT